ncbi:MAG TPA: CRISPR-associated endonuclease Cas2 [Paludibaculum sp.]|jgi:CRISPR-associated protein Cas2
MSLSEERAWLVAYDITESRRLVRVHRLLKQHALAVQYSVFAALRSERQIENVMARVRREIEETEDDVRVYPLPALCETHVFGPGAFPRGIELVDRQLIQLLSSGQLLGRGTAAALSESEASAFEDGEAEY